MSKQSSTQRKQVVSGQAGPTAPTPPKQEPKTYSITVNAKAGTAWEDLTGTQEQLRSRVQEIVKDGFTATKQYPSAAPGLSHTSIVIFPACSLEKIEVREK